MWPLFKKKYIVENYNYERLCTEQQSCMHTTTAIVFGSGAGNAFGGGNEGTKGHGGGF